MVQIKLRDGEVTIYTRPDSASYWVALHLPNGGRKQYSLRTKNVEDARERAIKAYDELVWRNRLGLTLQTKTFAEAAKAWLKHLEGDIRAGTRNSRNLADYEPVVRRYLVPFFGDKAIDTIKQPDIEQWKIWRRDYWITGPGSQEKQVYKRHGKEIVSNKRHKRTAPSPSTANGENTVLRGVFKHAVRMGWMTKDQLPLVENVKITRREARERANPVFTIAEYRQLRRFMTKWIADPKIGERERWRREATQDFLLILFNSGLREHELFKRDEKSKQWRGLRWKDVELFTSKGGCELVLFNVTGNTKTGSRQTVPLRAARYVLERRKLRCPNAVPEDFIMALPDGTLLNTFASSVRRLYKQAGLLACPKTGRNRGIYSGRHTYATGRIAAELSPAKLAANMGTSIAMLERSYYHHDAKAEADTLTGRRA
jgi:integrase